MLADGDVVVIRPLGPDDRDAVLRLHEGLDERDRYFRFFGPLLARVGDLVTGMVAVTDEHHASVGAFAGAGTESETLLGVAHYEVLADPTGAEVALAVTHTEQAHGVGTLLLEHLVSAARRAGVRRFVAEVLSENSRMLRLFSHTGLPCRMSHDGGTTRVELTLDEVEGYLDAVADAGAGRRRGQPAVGPVSPVGRGDRRRPPRVLDRARGAGQHPDRRLPG